MDDGQIKQVLESIAEQEIENSMDIWPQIQAQLQPTKLPAARQALRVGRLVAIVLILLVSAVAYALYQSAAGDPGLESIQDAKLITPLKMKQTIDKITVTLDWAYADSNRILVAYTVDEPQGINVNASGPNAGFRLTDDKGNYFNQNSWDGFGGLKVAPEAEQFIYGFDITCLGEAVPKDINLTFEATFSVEKVTADYAGGGGGGGGGGGVPCLNVADMSAPQPLPTDGSVAGPFKFNFKLPIIPAVHINQEQSVSVGSLQVTVKSLSITPSMTRATLCYDVPDSDDWSPDVQITLDGTTAGWSGMNDLPTIGDREKCVETNIPAPYLPGKTRSLTLTVNALWTSFNYTQANTEHFADILTKQGFKVNVTGFGEGFSYELVSTPEGMSSDELPQTIETAKDEAFRRHISGPWTFTFQLP